MPIRPAVPSDQPAIDAVVAAAFEEPVDGRVVQMMRALDDGGATRLGLVAVDPADESGEVVGHVQLSRAWIDARERLVDALMLTPLSVAPDRQRQGVGTALLEAALAAAHDVGAVAVVLEGSPVYYGDRGFVAAEPIGLLRPSQRIPGPAFQAALLPGHESWMTGRVVYPEAMWHTECVGLRDPFLAEVEAAVRAAWSTSAPTLSIQCLDVDCVDPRRVADFWQAALGWRRTADGDDEVVLEPPAGSLEEAVVPDLLFLRVPEAKTVKNRLHLDLRPDDPAAEVARLESLGARRVDVGQDDTAGWTVMADPEDNEFCVLRAFTAEQRASLHDLRERNRAADR